MSVAKPILEYVKTIKTKAELFRSTTAFRRLLKFYKPHLRVIAVVLGFSILGAYLFTLEPLFTAQIIDLVVTQGEIQLLPDLIIKIVISVVAFALVQFAIANSQGYLAQVLIRDIRSEYYSSLQLKSFGFYDGSSVGDLVSRATQDLQNVETFVKTWVSTLTNSVLAVVAVFIIMYSINPAMSLIAMIPMPLILYFTSQLWIQSMPLFRKMQLILGRLGGYIQQNIIGMKVVRIFRREEELDEGFRQVEQVFVDTAIKVGKIQSRYMPSGPAILTLGITMVYLYGGNLYAAPASILTIGGLTLFTRYMTRLTFPLRDLSMLSGTWINASAGLERIYEMIDVPSTVRDTDNAAEIDIKRGQVEFKNVTFGYEANRPVLRNINFKVSPGERIAILGATGSGKTSLIYLMPRFYDPDSGSVTIDGIDIKDFTIESLRRQIGLVLQDVFIFTGTIRDNIAFGLPEASMDDVISVAKLARMHEFIMTLPKAYDSVVGERGITLSGGQKQRLTIARTLLTKPKILIFDDALSFVDARTEQEIQDAIDEAMKGKTSFTIAQRLSTIKNADKILVLENGEIIEFGTHSELMEHSIVYRRIYETQFLQRTHPSVSEAEVN
ncbi:MAG TPA: ABC transporter ATP-binding protein [Candidatus Bathyarchaeia archaeon]|nr:MAG: hypothetical protein A3K70_00490 [Candidatus Bathyarchaeota archaeon RBG_16_48_13]HJX24220.1 ABC transporter ATP-binding protein [Candidatus Bathyarchaeia archaeon]